MIMYSVENPILDASGKRVMSARFWTPDVGRAFTELLAAPGRGRILRAHHDDEIPPKVRANAERAAAER